MIPIQKGEVPQILSTKGKDLTDEMKEKFGKGQTSFNFDSKVYGGASVKNALKKAQNHKCCFCESNLHAQHGDVEHFRPKGGWQQTDGDKLSEVGYYWLAYDWDNLLLSCQKCNQTFKKNFFPIEDPTTRAFDHTHDVQREISLILNPAIDNPQEHLLFKKEVITYKTIRGKETIKRTALDEELFEEDRRAKFQTVATLFLAIEIIQKENMNTTDVQTVIDNIREIINPKNEYYAMLRDNFKGKLGTLGVSLV